MKNKGWYVAKFTMMYQRRITHGDIEYQTATLAALQTHTFILPSETLSNSAVLVADAVAGKQIMSYNLREKRQCFDVWGTTQYPAWAEMNC